MNTWRLHSLPDLKDRAPVFTNRPDAGEHLAGMLREYKNSKALVLAIPAGGVPVAVTIANTLQLPLYVIPVSKILFPWTTESGFGAVAFDGTEWINHDMVIAGNLDNESVTLATAAAQAKVQKRMQALEAIRPLPGLEHKTVIVVDDGIAAGSTMRAAIQALVKANVRKIVLAVPTGHDRSLKTFIDKVEGVYCANVRSGYRFAVAEAYENWRDISDEEVEDILKVYLEEQ